MTIKDIARLSGFGISTVSRALNNHPDVSEKTKAKIKKITDKYKFEPNTNAKQLKQQQSKSIIIVVKGNMNIFFSGIIKQMQNKIKKAHYTVWIHYIDEDTNELRTAEKLCRERKPLGIIFLGGNVETFKKRFYNIKIPSILATNFSNELKFDNLSCVGIDDMGAADFAVSYLIQKGHKDIGIIGGDYDVSHISSLRLQGCKNSFSSHGLYLSDDSYEKANYNLESAYCAMNRLLLNKPNITAVFCMSDIMAVGAIRAVYDAGLLVPKDISVMGFDGTELSQYYIPKITTIVQPENKIASVSVELLLSQIEKNAQSKNVLIENQLSEGESVRPI